jgi:hypothetical protein
VSNQHLFEEVDKALSADDWATVKKLLEEVNEDWDTEARIYKGTVLTLSNEIDSYHKGVSLLRELADSGNGNAAHNLATALCSGVGATDQSREEFAHYMQVAFDSGFEETVSSDPMWWKKRT